MCDLDRTLIADDVELRPRTRAAIAAVRDAGIHFLIVTGRMFQSARPYALAAGIEQPLVCYQGAVVAEPGSGRFLRHEPIPLELAREAIAAVEDEGFTLNAYVDDELYVARKSPEAELYTSYQGVPIALHAVGDLLAWLEQPPTKLVAVSRPEALDALETQMQARFDGRLHIAKSLQYFLEFTAPGVTKAAGVAFLAEHLGFAQERSLAFGDGENDVELLDWAGYAVAVENAHERLLRRADWICPRASEEGVAQVLEAFLESVGADGPGGEPTLGS